MALREASFKGAPFHVEETGGQFGRRTVLHEYPFRDLPYGEDLGRSARRFDVQAFFLDRAAYEAFIAVCESAGAGTLIHPFAGKHFVQLENAADVRFPRAERGRYSVQLSFVEAGENTEPDAAEDAAGLLDGLIDDALAQIGADFAGKWPLEIAGWLSLAESRLNQVYDYIEQFLAPLELAKSQLNRLTLGSLLSKPIELFYRISGLIRLGGQNAKPFALAKNFGFQTASAPAFQVAGRCPPSLLGELRGTQPAGSWTATAIGADMQAVPPSLADAVRQIAVMEQARLLAFDDFSSRSDLLAARDRVLAALEAEIYIADATYRALEAVRMQTVAAVEARLPTLKEMRIINTQATMPALVLAWQVNGSIAAYDDIVARNKVRHPCFVPAGKVEVMLDGE